MGTVLASSLRGSQRRWRHHDLVAGMPRDVGAGQGP
jgi:hypothetical protein